MANEWDVVSEEPARPARVASGPQASAAADPWAVVGEAPARASVPDFSNVRGAVSPTVSVAPREGFFSGLMRIGSEGVRRGGAATVASLLHSGADLVDQTVQSGLRSVMEPLGLGEAFSDPLGARATADENLRIAQEISADRAAAQAAIGGRPSLAQAMEHPLDSAGQYARHIVNIGSESVIPMVAAMATRNPAAASAVLGGTVGAQEYTDLRGEGVDRPTALAAAGGTAAVEAAGEMFGLPAVLGTGTAGLRGLMRAAGAEGLQEFPVQIAQQNIEDVALGQETPVAQQLADALDAMIVGGAFGAGGHTVTNAPSYLSSVFAGEAPPVAPAQANPSPQPDTPRTNAIAPEMLAAGNEALREVGREELLAAAKARQTELRTKRDGTPDREVFDPETGKKIKVRGDQPSIMTPKEKELLEFLEKNEGNADALAKGFGFKLSESAAAAMAGEAPQAAPAANENKQAAPAAQPARARSAKQAGEVIDNRLQALREAAGRRLPGEERSALAAEAADLEALVREQDALSAAGVMGSPETRLTAAERAQADQRRAEIRAALEADRAAAEHGRQLQTLERQLGNIDTDAGLIDLAERIAGTPVDTGGKPAVQRAPQQSAANATGENRVQDQEGRRQAEGQGQAQEVVATEGGSGVSATPAAVPASSLEGDGNAAATREGADEGEQSRLDLIDAWRAAATPDERAAAAQRIAEHDARAADRGRAGGEARAGDVAGREAVDAGAVPADVRGADSQDGPGSAESRAATEALDRTLTRALVVQERVSAREQNRKPRDIQPVSGTVEVLPDGGNNAGAGRLADAIKRAFGLTTRVFRSSDPRWNGYDALTRVKGHENTAFINESSEQPFISTAAHELTHAIKTKHAELYERLDEALRKAGANVDAFMAEFLGPIMERNGETPYEADSPIAREELYAETGQVLLADKPFLQRLRRENPGLFNDFVNAAIDWIDTVLAKLGPAARRDIDISRYYNDLKAVRDAFAEYYAGAAKLQQQGGAGSASRARGPVASRARRVVTATTSAGRFQLTDEAAPAGTDFSEFGEVRQVIARDGNKQIGKLVYANDGTPPTIEVAPEYRRRGVATAMLKLARGQGGVLGDARSGMRRDGGRPGYRTDAGQAFREGADESRVMLRDVEQPVASRRQTDTPAFKRWFGDSKVVDANGEPLVVYHGTPMDFDRFNRFPAFFTDDAEAASGYASGQYAPPEVESGPNVMPVYLNIKNPAEYTAEELHAIIPADESDVNSIEWSDFDGLAWELEGHGYDGIIIRGVEDYVGGQGTGRQWRPYVQYVAFRPEQIKSATGNSGAFDPRNPSIIASRRTPRPDDADYRGEHTAPMKDSGAPAHDVTGGGSFYPDDVYGPNGLRYYGTGDDAMDAEAYAVIRRLKGHPNHNVTIYRAVPKAVKGGISAGDWVTTVRRYAVDHGRGALRGDYKIQSKIVRANEIFTNGDSWLEWGYDPQPFDMDDLRAARDRRAEKQRQNDALESANDQTRSEPRSQSIIASRRAQRSDEPFYSAALRAVEAGNGAPRRGTAEQWKGWLDGAVRRGEMKQSERDWLGIDDWIAKQGGAVTREALADYVRANQVQVQDVVLGAADQAALPDGWTAHFSDQSGFWIVEDEDGEVRGGGDTLGQAVVDAQENAGEGEQHGAAKFAEYQLPGGENYRELLLTLPQEKVEAKPVDTRGWTVQTVSDEAYYRYTGQREIRVLDARGDVMQSRTGFRGTDEEAIAQAAKAFQRDDVTQQRDAKDFRSSHFDQPNILAHVRFNERTDADGKRVLFIEEIQSDWHQQGRKHGYGEGVKRYRVLGPDGLFVSVNGTENSVFSSRADADSAAAAIPGSRVMNAPSASTPAIPVAPFKATDEWAMLAFKRMVRHAAENGFDRIAWTTGEQQAERYDLSKSIDAISYRRDGDRFDVEIEKNGKTVESKDGMTLAQIEDYAGKDISDKMSAGYGSNGGDGWTYIRGDGLRAGGSGMRGFYDKILPSAVNKWAKRFGGKVGQTIVHESTSEEATRLQRLSERGHLTDTLKAKLAGTAVHAIDLTPAMRDAALEGQPLFSRRTPQRAQAERNSLFGRLAASGYAMGNATQPQPGGRFVSLQRAADGLRVKLQDKMLPALRVQERATAGGASQAGVSTLTLDDMQNAYRMENLRHGATKEGVDKLNDEHVMPIQRALRDAGLSLAVFEDYLYALAAPERNASIAQINRGMPDAGSGIATQQARDILAGRAPGVYSGKVLTPDALRLFKSLEPHVRAIRNIALDSAVEAGQLPAQLANSLRQKYPNYVPMRGKDDVLDQTRPSTGRGLSQARSGMKRALGRGQDNIPQNVLGELIGDAQRGIAAREQSKATKAFLRFALANPMPELFEVEPVDLEWKFSESTGEAYLGVKGRAEDVGSKMIVMQDGKPVYVKFHDEGLRDAILNMGVEDFAGFTKWAGWLNRWRSAVLTRFNPMFPPVNIMRDILFGGTAIATEQGAAAAARAAGIYRHAMAAAWAHARGRRGDASVPDAQKTIADWVQEFYETGGSTGLTMANKPADLQRKLEMASASVGELMRMAAAGRPLPVVVEAISRKGKPIIDIIESANEASENALRIATYIEQRQRGVSKFKAAEYAKNVTINFNRKGQLGPVLNAIYLFYNASMQGTHAVLRVLRNPKAMAFLAGMGALQAMLAASMMGDDDDDGITQWDTVPDYVKRTSLVIPVGDDRYFALPMPYGFNLITYAAGRATQYAYSGRRKTDSSVALDILKSATEAFSPVPVQDGYSALFGDQLAFFMRLGANRDDFGGKLTNTDEYSHYPVPLALQGKATTPRIYHSTAQLLAKLGGGDLAEKIPPVGYLDVSPEQLEAVTNYFGGGITSLLNKSMTWGEQMQAGNLRGVSDVVAATPIASRFYGKPSDARAIAERYYGERGEFARHRAIVNERVATGMPLEKAKEDRPKEYVQGLEQGTYKRSGKRKDGSRYRAGEKRPGIQETEGTPAHTAKDVRKRVSDIGELIAGVREGMTNAELSAAYSAQHRIAKQTVGSNFMPEGMTGKPADLGLPAGFAEAAPAPARVKNRAIKLLQDLRAAEEQRLLRSLRFQRRLDSVKVPEQPKIDWDKFDKDFEATYGGDNFDPEAISP